MIFRAKIRITIIVVHIVITISNYVSISQEMKKRKLNSTLPHKTYEINVGGLFKKNAIGLRTMQAET